MIVEYSIKFEPNIPLMLRDGTITYVDIYRPDSHDQFPALLKRTPYNKDSSNSRTGVVDAVWAASKGYAVVIQDIRGCFSSGGEFYPFINEASDGVDSIEWIASQQWCTGKVAMYGNSYMGAVQWLAANLKPPSLAAIVTSQTACDFYNDWIWHDGAFELAFNIAWSIGPLTLGNWNNLSGRLYLPPKQLDLLIEAHDNLWSSYNYIPMLENPTLEGGFSPYYHDWLGHPNYDEYWENISIDESFSEINIPVFNIGGWYDKFLSGTILNFTRLQNSDLANRTQKLLIGPWVHGSGFDKRAGDTDFGVRASGTYADIQGQILQFCDYCLKGDDNNVFNKNPVRIFVMGENVWRDEKEWPIDGAKTVSYYLHSNGRANTLNGDGYLSEDLPMDEPSDVYVYNPMDPVPTHGGSVCFDLGLLQPGAFDQRHIELRHDVLVYTTPPLNDYVEVTGPITVGLYASSSAIDTDFTAKLVDVSPEGYATNLTDGILRARYRVSRSEPSMIKSGEVYEYTIDMCATSNLFKKGHQIRLEISSSNFPRFDRNANTGRLIGSDDSFLSALQTVYHTSKYPSYISLPMIQRG